ncbi:MAG: hypothetical protein ACYS1A_20540 [Planctomycetota bacterium]|jgi:hypothetical protein
MSAKDIAPYKGKRRKLLDTLASADNADDGVDDICKKAGLSRTIYYKYIDEPQFRAALKAMVERTYARYAPQIANSMVKQAKKGNIRAGDLIHKVLGFIEPGNRQSVNVAVHKDDKPTTLQIDTAGSTPMPYTGKMTRPPMGRLDIPKLSTYNVLEEI